MRIGRRKAVGLLALGAVVLLNACDRSARVRLQSIEAALLERAPRLVEAERRLLRDGLILAETEFDVPVFLLIAVAERESRFRPRAKSGKGALGLLQIRPATARDVAARHDIEWPGEHVLLEPTQNLRIGAAYLAELHERFGSWDLALTAYSYGPTRARQIARQGTTPSSRYAAHVMKIYHAMSEAAGAKRP